MLTFTQKQEQVAELHEKLGRASSVIVADYRGLDVASVSALRAKLRAISPDLDPIRTLRGTGYALAEDLPPAAPV